MSIESSITTFNNSGAFQSIWHLCYLCIAYIGYLYKKKYVYSLCGVRKADLAEMLLQSCFRSIHFPQLRHELPRAERAIARPLVQTS